MGRRIDRVMEWAAALANLMPAHRTLLLADDEGRRADAERGCG